MVSGSLFELVKGELVDIVDYAFEHHRETGRAPKLVVNASSWWYANMTRATVQEIRDRTKGAGVDANPIEANILYYTLRILHLGVQLHYVFDGPRRLSNGGKLYPGHDEPSELFRDTLTKMGIPWHEAPAEAEAECAKMEIEGLVDGVWSEDGDALAFGCKTLIRFQLNVVSSTERAEDVRKSYAHFRIYRLADIEMRHPGMDREGFILHAILNGQPKDVVELYNLTPQDVLNAAELGLGKSLCAASTMQEDLGHWATGLLAAFLKGARRTFAIPPDFPKWEHVQDYLNPVVSTAEALRTLPQPGDPFLNERATYDFLVDKFQWTVKKWAKYVVPYRIVRSLLATGEGEAAQHDHLDLKCDVKKKPFPKKAKATFDLCNATSLDTSSLGPKAKGQVDTLMWIIRKSNYNKQPSITSYLLTPDSAQKGKGVALGPSQRLGGGINSTPPTPASISPSSSNGEGPSERRNRVRRASTPPSPTPTTRKRKLPWEGASVTKNIRRTPKKPSFSQSKDSGKGKGKEKEVPDAPNSSAGSSTSQPQAASQHVLRDNIYDNDDEMPQSVAEPPSTPPAQVTEPADAIQNIIVLNSSSDDDDFGSFPSVAADQLFSTPLLRKTADTGQDVIMIDSDDEDDFGSFPSDSQLAVVLEDAAEKELVQESIIVEESSGDEYGSFPSSSDLVGLD